MLNITGGWGIRIFLALWLIQFTGCAQVEQTKTIFEKEIAFEAGNNAMVNENHTEAAAQYLKAAQAGHAEAAYYLGLLYSGGGNIPEDKVEASKWMRVSAEKSYAPAQQHLGMWFLTGSFVPKNLSEAAGWLRRAAEQGNESAMYFLGVMSATGQGMSKDYNAALGWFQMANAKGFPVPPEQLTLEGIAALDKDSQSAPPPAEKRRPATVRNVQDGLTQLGYKPGPVDGMMGKRTANAIRTFQRDVGMPEDGKVSDALMRRIDKALNK